MKWSMLRIQRVVTLVRRYSSNTYKWEKLSYFNQPGKEPLQHCTIGQLVFKSSEKWKDREALVSTHQNKRFTFLEVNENVSKLAAGFLNIGLKPGDSIGIWGSNTVEWYMTSLAANMAGLIVGTTGKPKGTVLSHHIIVNNSFFTGKRIGLHQRHHRLCLNVPFFHCFGNVCGILCGLHFGCTLILPSGSFRAEDSVNTIAKEKCTVFYGTPTMHNDLISTKEKLKIDVTSVEMIVSGGAICSAELFEKLRNTFGLQRVASYYGMTETGPISFASFCDDDAAKAYSTVGAVLDHLEVKVVDSSEEIVPMGTPGELCVRGYSTMLGYWGEKEATDKTIDSDGWLKTGDQIILNESGYGVIVGRIKDIIIRGGENVFPKEIEEHLEKHPLIIEAQVFGVPDERLGEAVCAAIRTSDCNMNKQDIINFCKGKIAHFKIPFYILFVKEFPKTASGKIQKFKLREALEQELNLNLSK